MWPWEHLAVGYLAYSLTVRLVGSSPGGSRNAGRPTGVAVLVLAGATQLPDLVDKPLAWVFGVLPAGTTLAHSALVAVPVATIGLAIARRRDRPEVGVAFAVGYLSHLAGDVTYPVLVGQGPKLWFLLWPVRPVPPGEVGGVFRHVEGLFSAYATHLASPAGLGYLLGELALLGLAAVVWLRDGAPGLGFVRRVVFEGLSASR